MRRPHETVSESTLLETRVFHNFHLLPLVGEVSRSRRFWSGYSWPFSKGSINLRWNTEEREGFAYRSPSRREALALPLSKLKALAPSEKYDIFMGRYDYPLKNEVDFFSRTGSMDWEGLCHGWAGASLNHDEPLPLSAINPDGIEVPFGSSDIKALLSYAYSKILIKNDETLGKRCEVANLTDNDDFCDDDLSPDIFHLVLSNKLGLKGQSVIADIDRFQEVWNHPVTKYESVIEKMTDAGIGKVVVLKTKVTYVDVVEKNTWLPHSPVIGYMTLKYQLNLDASGNIINGKWLSEVRPDFIWVISKAKSFDGYLSGLKRLVK